MFSHTKKGIGRRTSAFTLALVSLLAIPASAMADDLTVNDDTAGPGPAGATCASPDEASIQDAINSAVAGDNIFVCAGTYIESVNVDKQLALRGAQAGIDAKTRGGPSAQRESLITGSGGPDGGVGLNDSDITFDGFAVVNAADPAIGAGIAMAGAESGHTVVNNIVRENTIGISANSAGGTPSMIADNKISNNNVPGAAAGNGIYGDGNIDDLTIDGNYFTDQTNTAILLTETDSTSEGVEITDNTFEATAGSAFQNELRVLLLFTDGALIGGNTFTDVANNAVQLADGNTDTLVAGNSMTDGGFAAVRITDFGETGENTGVSVVGNTMLDNDAAINVNVDSHLGVVTARGNRIAGNTAGVILDDADATVSAEDNWWGCNEGTTGPDCDPIAGANSTGVDAAGFLRLRLNAPARIKAGKRKPIRATIVGGTPCAFPDDTAIAFATTKGRIRPTATSDTANCVANSILKAGGKDSGRTTVSATLDNETVTDRVKIKRKKRK